MFGKLAAVAITGVLVASLSGCTPPMPPEILSALAEQEFTCVEGTSVISVPASTTDMAPGWQFAAGDACPGMNFEIQYDDASSADLVFSTSNLDPSLCKSAVEVPFAVDAGVLVYQHSDGNMFNFSPALIAKIFSGEISDWSDPAIAEANMGAVYMAGPITFLDRAYGPALESFNSWMKRLVPDFNSERIQSGPAISAADLFLEEGQIAIVSNSVAMELGLMPAGVINGPDSSVDVIYPDTGSIGSAATQFDIATEPNRLTVAYNSANPALPAPGAEVAQPPYEAVYTAPLHICGEASLAKRAAARFILRQDQQGAMAATYFVPITESIRVSALAVVSEGLTLPSFDPEDYTG